MAGIKTEKSNWRYRLLPRSLFGRSLLIIALPALIMQATLGFVFFDRHWDAISSKLVDALSGDIRYVVKQIQHAKTQKEIDDILTNASASLNMTVSIPKDEKAVSERGGDPFDKIIWFSVPHKLDEALDMMKLPYVVKPYEREKWFMIEVEYKPGHVVRFLSHEKRLVTVTTYIFVLWLLGSAFVLFGISIMFMRNQIRPILRLAVAAEKFGKGQDVPDFRPVGAIEVRKASAAFLLMRDRLRRQIEQRTLMLAGVSHDLRTPLTRMKLELAMAPPGVDVDNLRQDVEEMEKMIEGYLTFAKGDGDETAVMSDLPSIIRRVAANAGREGHSVHVTAPDNLMIRLRPVAVERAIANLVGNACRFASEVWITLAVHQDGDADIIIDDNGPGIAPDARDDVFRPFFRLEKSRNKKTGGVGLGLSIAQDIAHSHGGEITLDDSPKGGLRVVLSLPA